ncbi:mechanosensitive ion channel [Xanthomonadaceae bacterium XH05]|nr:mechanosensitive ion channel [Xanthomonadaceae bacterium XH05]
MRHLPLLLSLGLCLLPPVSLAQPLHPSASLSADIVQAHKALSGETALDETRRNALTSLLDRAAADDAEAEAEIARAHEISRNASSARARIDELDTDLRTDPSEQFAQWRESLDTSATPAALTQQAADLDAAAISLSARIADTMAQLAVVDQRPAAIAQDLDQARRETDVPDSPFGPSPGATLSQQIGALSAQAHQRLRLARIQRLSAERAALPIQARHLELSQRSLQRQATLVRRQIDVIASLLARSTDAELTALDSRLRGEADDGTEQQSPLLAAEAARNIQLGQELASIESATRQASEQLRRTRVRTDDVADTLRNTQARLALQSHDDAVGSILLNERRRIDDPMRIRQDLSQIRRNLARVQLRLIDLDEEADTLSSPVDAVDALLRNGDEDAVAIDTHSRDGLHALLGTRVELVARLASAERELLRVFTELEAASARQLELATTLAHLLDRELLWFPSHEQAGPAWLKRQPEGWADMLNPSRYLGAMGLLDDAAKRDWPLLAMVGALFAILLQQRRRLPTRLAALAQPLLRVRTDRYRHTLRALLASGFAALVLPLPVALSGWLLRQASETGRFSDSLGQALLATAGGLYFYQFLNWLVADNGVAQKHFRWTQGRREAISRAMPWFLYLLLPAQFLLTLAFVRGQEPAVDTVARSMLLLICGVGAFMAWRLLAPGALWTFRGIADPEPSHLRRTLRVSLPGALAATAVLALAGYVLTAILLVHSLWLSLLLTTALAILHGLVSRWFLLGERRLALRRSDAQREAGEESAMRPLHAESEGTVVPADPESEALSIQSVNQQTRRLLRALIAVLMTLGLLWVWSGVLPALDRLDTITLWSVKGTDASGAPLLSPITLAAVLAGLLTMAFTAIAARNLPGLVELGLLSRIHIDAGARYAVTSVSRYLIVIAGTLIGLGLFGVHWSQLQWLAAALTVGLGFGLQEIFANFVSGLIVLFERPYRVGDTITIGEVEGRVTRIRTRATTILDADNREVVVPNKTFITSRFVNWTLSDTVTRVVFKIGFTQDAEPQKVRKLLLDLARNEPLVLAQPAPGCWFTQISANTCDFELRLFVAELGHRTHVRNALNHRIIEAMNASNLATSRPGLLRIEMQPSNGGEGPRTAGA